MSSIQNVIEDLTVEKMEQCVNDEDINDVNMELINVTERLSDIEDNKCICVSKNLYYYKKCFDMEYDSDDSDSSDSDSSMSSDSDDSDSEFDDIILTYEFPYYGHLVKNLTIVQKKGMNILKCVLKTKRSNIKLFETVGTEPVNIVEIATGNDLIPIVNLDNDSVVVKLWVNTSKKLNDFELQHDVYFFKDQKVKEIRKTKYFTFKRKTYKIKKGKLKKN